MSLYLVIVLHMVTGRELHLSRVSPNMDVIPSISIPRLRLCKFAEPHLRMAFIIGGFPRHPTLNS